MTAWIRNDRMDPEYQDKVRMLHSETMSRMTMAVAMGKRAMEKRALTMTMAMGPGFGGPWLRIGLDNWYWQEDSDVNSLIYYVRNLIAYPSHVDLCPMPDGEVSWTPCLMEVEKGAGLVRPF